MEVMNLERDPGFWWPNYWKTKSREKNFNIFLISCIIFLLPPSTGLTCFRCFQTQSRQSAKRFSSRWNWDSPTPLAAGECAPPPCGPGGRAHSLAAKGVGESQFQRGDIHCGALYILVLCASRSWTCELYWNQSKMSSLTCKRTLRQVFIRVIDWR